MNFLFLSPACVTCMSQDGQVTTLAANGAVYVMFVALALVFCGITAVVVAFSRRAKKYAASQEQGTDLDSLL